MALLELSGVVRQFRTGDASVAALRGIDLAIDAGEFVAIVGPSGCGKSTLLNILGCLDRPNAGSYKVGGRDTSTLDGEELAALRREHFGFVFQRYHLLPHLDALGNVEVPGVYAGQSRTVREERATELLGRLGMAQRLSHRPSQLSGGQQQRVSVARALMNGADVILADEPTGALDSESGKALLAVLRELNEIGHTVIVVTHDHNVAAVADRTIEFHDGVIVKDSGPLKREHADGAHVERPQRPARAPTLRRYAGEFREAFTLAIKSVMGNRLRSALTMLGVIIGTASVVTIMAVTQGARASIEKSVGTLAANSLDVWRGKGWGDDLAGSITTLTPTDIQILSQLPFVTGVSPQANTEMRLRYRHKDVKGQATGASANGVAINGVLLGAGRDLSSDDVIESRQVVVISEGVRAKLFEEGDDPLGRQILVGEIPFVVVGVSAKLTGGIRFNWDGGETVWIPYSTALTRILGRNYFDGLHVHLTSSVPPALAEKRVTELLERTHGKKDFNVQNRASQWQEFSNVTLVFSLVMGLIAAISLFVGGVGVMNIMLVAVAERTQEIGIRVAVGARPADIARQFLIEAVTLCAVGGVIGLLLAMLLCFGVSLATDKMQPIISLASVAAAFGTCSAIGIVFGWLPARRAARLDPVVALARE